jgi:quinol-cytochrome oxidoreductase complex cytochrome b subunit
VPQPTTLPHAPMVVVVVIIYMLININNNNNNNINNKQQQKQKQYSFHAYYQEDVHAIYIIYLRNFCC